MENLYDEDEDISAETSFTVKLYIYDMSKGLANSLSQMVLGKHIEGIWHTGIVVYGREYFYGAGGIESCRPGGTILQNPDKILNLGMTEVPYSVFLEYVFALGEAAFKPGTYDLIQHNCNNFSNEVSMFLTGKSVPPYVLNLPQDVLDTPLGEALRPFVESLSLRAQGSRGVSFGAVAEDEANRRQSLLDDHALSVLTRIPPAGHAAEHEAVVSSSQTEEEGKSLSKSPGLSQPKEQSEVTDKSIKVGKMADLGTEENKEDSRADSEVAELLDERRPETEGGRARGDLDDDDDDLNIEPRIPRRERPPRDPPIIFTDVNAASAYDVLEREVKGSLSDDEGTSLLELHEFVVNDNGVWALGAQHLQLIGKLLYDKAISPETKKALLQFLQAAALKDDVILLLHMDRRDHVLMNYINDFETFDPDLQEEIAKLMCNLCQPATASDWLMYISEWQQGRQSCSNSRVTTRVAVNSLLSDRPGLQEKGIKLMYNLGLKEVFDDTATELASAVLQFLHGDLTEEQSFYVLSALLRFMGISYNDVPALVKMMGPDISKFIGKSARVDGLVEQIQVKLSTLIGV